MEPTRTTTTRWRCETCRSEGTIVMDEHAGVWKGYQRTSEDHKRAMPDCPTGDEKVRVEIETEAEDRAY